MSADIVRIFDTTLRDGEQAPGCSMTVEEKRQVARQLARLGVDVNEAGFPAASPGDWEAVRTIAEDAYDWPESPVLCGLARATRKDIEAAANCMIFRFVQISLHLYNCSTLFVWHHHSASKHRAPT